VALAESLRLNTDGGTLLRYRMLTVLRERLGKGD
jgi:hypothetical protein